MSIPTFDPTDLTTSRGYFDDFEVGQRFRHPRGATIGEVENGLLTKTVMNTADAHWNEHALSGDEGFGLGQGRVVFGLITASVVFGLASEDVTENALRELSCHGFRFLSPVHHGDTIYAFTEVLAVTAADGDHAAGAGIVTFKHWGVTHDHRVVFEGERTVLVKRRPARLPN